MGVVAAAIADGAVAVTSDGIAGDAAAVVGGKLRYQKAAYEGGLFSMPIVLERRLPQ